ncbi:MAG: NAD-dependent epimerase/dehydratase family protein [Promethearchaeota archaeon]|nr:MAG: NAD-dependent epimerase/dehydratase family protein [Candidatus Lokiarchaeota archaeon]
MVVNQDLTNEKIVVAGGTGFIGSRVVRKLVKEGVNPKNIRVIYYPGSLTTALDDLPVELYPLDILDSEKIPDAFNGFSYLFYLIGNTAMDSKSKRIQWLINVEGTRNMLENCQDFEKIVYTSTVNTLGSPNPVGSLGDESSSPYVVERPEIGKEIPKFHSFDSPDEILEFADAVHDGSAQKKWWKRIGIGYFDSKLAAQELVNRAYKDHGFSIVSVLPGQNYGPGDDMIGNGLYLLRIYDNSMPGYTKGGGNPCMHVDDQANGHYLAMLKGKEGERYIITGLEEDNLYLKDKLRIITEVVQEKQPDRKIKVPTFGIGKKVGWFVGLLFDFISKFKKDPMPVGRASIRAGGFTNFYSYHKAEKELGYKPKRTFRQAVDEMYEYYKEIGYLGMKKRIGLEG